MKLITLWQPWASLMEMGAKAIETRVWSTTYRGLVAIHAAKTWNEQCRGAASSQYCWDAMPDKWGSKSQYDRLRSTREMYAKDILPFGSIIAVGNLVNVYPTESLKQIVGERERAFGDYSQGRFGLVFVDVLALGKPIPFKSRQGKLLDCPADIEGEISRQTGLVLGGQSA